MISIVALTVGIFSLVAILCGGLGAKFFLDKKNAEVWFPTYNKTVMDDEGNFYEDSSARFPHDNTMEGTQTPAQGYPGLLWENVSITTHDSVKIHGWLLKTNNNSQDAKTIMFYHNNGGNIGSHLPKAMTMLEDLSVNIMLLEYRGYGYSEGKPSEKGLKIDAVDGFDALYARKDIDKSKIFIFGGCLGGAVAVFVAKERQTKIAGVILENTFTSTADAFLTLVRKKQPWLSRGLMRRIVARPLVQLFTYSRWETDKILPQLQLPVLFVSGTDDFFRDHMHQMFSSFNSGWWLSIEGGDHFNMWHKDNGKYAQGVLEFMKGRSNKRFTV